MLNKKDFINSLIQQYNTSFDITKEDIVAMIDRGFIFSITDEHGDVLYDNDFYANQNIFEARFYEFINTKNYYTDIELLNVLVEKDSSYIGINANVFNELAERNLIDTDLYYKVSEHKYLFLPDIAFETEMLNSVITDLEEQLLAEEQDELDEIADFFGESIGEDETKKNEEPRNEESEEEIIEEVFIIESDSGKQKETERKISQKRIEEQRKLDEQKRLQDQRIADEKRFQEQRAMEFKNLQEQKLAENKQKQEENAAKLKREQEQKNTNPASTSFSSSTSSIDKKKEDEKELVIKKVETFRNEDAYKEFNKNAESSKSESSYRPSEWKEIKDERPELRDENGYIKFSGYGGREKESSYSTETKKDTGTPASSYQSNEPSYAPENPPPSVLHTEQTSSFNNKKYKDSSPIESSYNEKKPEDNYSAFSSVPQKENFKPNNQEENQKPSSKYDTPEYKFSENETYKSKPESVESTYRNPYKEEPIISKPDEPGGRNEDGTFSFTGTSIGKKPSPEAESSPSANSYSQPSGKENNYIYKQPEQKESEVNRDTSTADKYQSESKYKNDYPKESPLSANPFKPSSFEDLKSPETSYRNPTNIPISSPEENKELLKNKDGTITFSGSSVSNKVAHSEQAHPYTEPVSDPYAPHFSSDTQKRESIKSFDEKISSSKIPESQYKTFSQIEYDGNIDYNQPSSPSVYHVPLANGSYMTFKSIAEPTEISLANLPPESKPNFSSQETSIIDEHEHKDLTENYNHKTAYNEQPSVKENIISKPDPYDNYNTRIQTMAVSTGVVLSTEALSQIMNKVNTGEGFEVTITKKDIDGKLETTNIFNSNNNSQSIASVFEEYKTAARVNMLPESSTQKEKETAVLYSIGIATEPLKIDDNVFIPPAVPNINPKIFIEAQQKGAKTVEVNGIEVNINEMIKTSTSSFSVVKGTEVYCNADIAAKQLIEAKNPNIPEDIPGSRTQTIKLAETVITKSAEERIKVDDFTGVKNADTIFTPAFILDKKSEFTQDRYRTERMSDGTSRISTKTANGFKAINTIGSASDFHSDKKDYNIVTNAAITASLTSFIPQNKRATIQTAVLDIPASTVAVKETDSIQSVVKIGTPIYESKSITPTVLNTPDSNIAFVDFSNPYKVEAIASSIDITQPEIAQKLRKLSFEENGDIATVLYNETLYKVQSRDNRIEINQQFVNGEKFLSNHTKYISGKAEYAEKVAAAIEKVHPEQAQEIRNVSKTLNGEIATVLYNQTIAEKRKVLHTKEAQVLAREFLANPDKYIIGNVAGTEAVAQAVEETSAVTAIKLRKLSEELNKGQKIDKDFKFGSQIQKERSRVIERAKIDKSEAYGDLITLNEERKSLKFKKISGTETLENSQTRIKNNAKEAEMIASAIEKYNPKRAAEIRAKSAILNRNIRDIIPQDFNKITSKHIENLTKNADKYIKGNANEIEAIAQSIEGRLPQKAEMLRHTSFIHNKNIALGTLITTKGILKEGIDVSFLAKTVVNNPEKLIKGDALTAEHLAVLINDKNPELAKQIRDLSLTLNGENAKEWKERGVVAGKIIDSDLNPNVIPKINATTKRVHFTYKKDDYGSMIKNDERISFSMSAAVGVAAIRRLSYGSKVLVSPSASQATSPMLSIVERDRYGRKYVTLATLGSDGRMNITFNSNRKNSTVSILGYAPDLAGNEMLSLPNSVTNKSRLLRAHLKARYIEEAHLIKTDGSHFTLSPNYVQNLNLTKPNINVKKVNSGNIAEKHFENIALHLYAFYALNKTFDSKNDFEKFQDSTKTKNLLPDDYQRSAEWQRILTPYSIEAYDKYNIKNLKSQKNEIVGDKVRRYLIRRPQGLNNTYLFAGYNSILGYNSMPTIIATAMAIGVEDIKFRELTTDFMLGRAPSSYTLTDGTKVNFHSGVGRVKIIKDLKAKSISLFGNNLTTMSTYSLQKILANGNFNGIKLTSDQRKLIENILLTKGIHEGVFSLDIKAYFAEVGVNLKGTYKISESLKADGLDVAIADACNIIQLEFKDIFKNVNLNNISTEKLKELLKDPNLTPELKTKLEKLINIKEFQANKIELLKQKRDRSRRLRGTIKNKIFRTLSPTMLGAGLSAMRNVSHKIHTGIDIIKTIRKMRETSTRLAIEKFRNAKPGSRAYKKYTKNKERYEKRFQKFEKKQQKRADRAAKKQGRKNKKAKKKADRRNKVKNKIKGRISRHKRLNKVTNKIGRAGRKLKSINNARKRIVGKLTAPFKKLISLVENLKQKLLSKLLLPLAKYVLIFILIVCGLQFVLSVASGMLEAVFGIFYAYDTLVTQDTQLEGLAPSEYLPYDRAQLCIALDSTLRHYGNELASDDDAFKSVVKYVNKNASDEDIKKYYDPKTEKTFKDNTTDTIIDGLFGSGLTLVKDKYLGTEVDGIKTGVNFTYYNGDGEEIGYKSNAKDIVALANAWIGEYYHCRGLYKSYVEKLWDYSHAISYSAKKQSNGKYVYACDSHYVKYICSSCRTEVADSQKPPQFCTNCGNVINKADAVGTSDCHFNSYTYKCNDKNAGVYNINFKGHPERVSNIVNGVDKNRPGKTGWEALAPYSETGCTSHELVYHRQSSANGYVDVSMQVQGLSSYSALKLDLPNKRVAEIKFYTSSLNPESLAFGQPVPAPAGCKSWRGTLICLKYDKTGDWNYVPVYYCVGCTYNHDKNYTCTCYATYNGSGYELTTPAAFFHSSFPIYINYSDGTAENTVSYFNPKWYYGADGKTYYLGIPNTRMESRQFELLTPETRNYWNSKASGYNTYAANYLSASQRQPSVDNGYQAFTDNAYELCNKNGCIRQVFHGSPKGGLFLIKEISYEDYGKFAATKPDRNDMQEYFDGCLNVEVIDTGTSFKVYCGGHYVCTGCHTGNTVQNTDVPVRYCTGSCTGHTIEQYCTGHIDMDISMVTLFLEDDNSLAYLGVPKKVTSSNKELTITRYPFPMENEEKETLEVQKPASGTGYLYKSVSKFKEKPIFDYESFPLIPYYQTATLRGFFDSIGLGGKNIELKFTAPEVVDPGNAGNPLSTVSWIPMFQGIKKPKTMDEMLSLYFSTFDAGEAIGGVGWYDHNDFIPEHVKDIHHIKSSNDKFFKYHYFDGFFEYDSSGNLIMKGGKPQDTGRFARAWEAYKEDWWVAYKIPFPGAYNTKPSQNELDRLYINIAAKFNSQVDLYTGDKQKRAAEIVLTNLKINNSVKNLLDSIGSSYTGKDGLDFAYQHLNAMFVERFGASHSVLTTAYNKSCAKSNYHDKVLEFRKWLGHNVGSLSLTNMRAGTLLGIGDEIFVVLYHQDVGGSGMSDYFYALTVNGGNKNSSDKIHLVTFSREYLWNNRDICWQVYINFN